MKSARRYISLGVLVIIASACADAARSTETPPPASAVVSSERQAPSASQLHTLNASPSVAVPDRDGEPPGPDGGWVLYADGYGWHLSDPSGNRTLVVRNGAETLRACPEFSPDGYLIAYREVESGAAMAALKDDGTLVVAADLKQAATCPRWSPDGRSVAFLGYTNKVWIASLDGETREVALCQRALECNQASDLAWTHHGSALVVLRSRMSATEVIALPLDGSGALVVHEATDEEKFSGIVPSPTGPYVAVVGWRERSVADGSNTVEHAFIRVIDLDGEVLFEETTLSYLEGGVAWSPDGSRLAWGDRDGIFIRPPDPDREALRLQLPAMPRAGLDAVVNNLAWSPDGKRFLLHVSTDAGGHAHAIVSIPAAGSGDVVVHSPWTISLESSFHGWSWQPR